MPLFDEYAQKRNVSRLDSKKTAALRQQMAEWQDNIDPISRRQLSRPVQDHDHYTGYCRMTLSASTNTLEGHLRRSLARLNFKVVDWPNEMVNAAYCQTGALWEAFQDDYAEIFHHYPSASTLTQCLYRFVAYYGTAWGEMGHLIHSKPCAYIGDDGYSYELKKEH